MSGGVNIALIGFGEVGQVLAMDLAPKTDRISAWDILFLNPESAPSKAAAPIYKATGAGDAVRGASLVISAVTAAKARAAAESAANAIVNDAWYLDLNSASPGVKTRAAEIINDAGGRYVEAAVMSQIGPQRLGCPILFGGPHAGAFLPLARDLGFSGSSFFSDQYGKASAAKMCRSVMVKGVEALLTESLLSARRYGVEETVVASLSDFFPGPDWTALSKHMISRALAHGERRAEEMREAAETVKEAGLSPLMSLACAERQAKAVDFAYALDKESLSDMLDAILDGAGPERAL